jgi:hypothetical protein
VKLVKAFVALLLLPAFAGAYQFAAAAASRLEIDRVPWIPLLVFCLGISSWFLIHVLFPRPTWFYVFGHESTHALAVLLSGGRIRGFKVSSSGGHVVSDRISAFIALSPYLVPFYPLVLGLGWIAALLLWPEGGRYTIVFLAFWGMSWGFHFAFTGSLLKTNQEDFATQGYFFSWVVILLVNLWIFLLLLTVGLRPFSFSEGLHILAQSLLQGYQSSWRALQALKSLLS